MDPHETRFSVGAPDLKTADRRAYAVAKYLRHRSELKQRPALLAGNERHDMFRLKRVFRAFDSPDYEKARKSNPILPELSTREQRIEISKLLLVNRFICGVHKLETEDAVAAGKKPISGIPVVTIAPNQTFGDNDYFVWMWNPISISTYLWGVGSVSAAFAGVMYPLWPHQLRRGLYYVSLLAIGFLIFMCVVAVIRLIVRIITDFTNKPGIWLFPNLFADVGFFASFKPLWAYSNQRTLPGKPKKRRRAAAAANGAAAAGINAGAAGTNAGVAGTSAGAAASPPGSAQIRMPPRAIRLLAASGKPPSGPLQPQELLQMLIAGVKNIAKANAFQRIQKEMPGQTGPEAEAAQQKILQEELAKGEQELREITVELQQAQAQAQAANGAAN